MAKTNRPFQTDLQVPEGEKARYQRLGCRIILIAFGVCALIWTWVMWLIFA